MLRRVSGTSMTPALRSGQIVIATRYFRKLKPDDIVIVRHDGRENIKRISKIREGEVYVLGDNPAASTDSRTFGWLRVGDVIAKLRWPIPPFKT